jgi:hypothetical protein
VFDNVGVSSVDEMFARYRAIRAKLNPRPAPRINIASRVVLGRRIYDEPIGPVRKRLIESPLALDHKIAGDSTIRLDYDKLVRHVLATYPLITYEDLMAHKRSRDIARARQHLMWLCKRHTTLSFPQIARKIGNRDHSTIIYGVWRFQQLIDRGEAKP